jgi:hypothetical protein
MRRPKRPPKRIQTLAQRKTVLIINAYFDPWRSATPTRWFVPRAMAPFYLAGYFDRERVEVRVWDEAFDGPLLDIRILEWPDLVIFTGLTASFDRAHQLCAYFRHMNPLGTTVIGGPIARALPALCSEIFDYVAQGDVESLAGIVTDLFGPDYVDGEGAPRFDLARPTMGLGYLETTKNCNFACSFCSLTAEGRPYTAHSDASIARQLDAMGRVFGVMVLDNNFYGNSRESFRHRTELIGERWRRGQFRGWGALVTGDFFKRPENLDLMAQNGCKALFSGVESLDPKVLKHFNKKHSMASDPRALTELCAAHGMTFDYGMITDFTEQTVAEVAGQIDGILADHRIPLPGLLSVPIPILGTPHFVESARAGRMMPNLALSDMDGMKLVEWPREPLETVRPFFADLLRFRGRKTALAHHAVRHAWHWRHHVNWDLTALAFVRPLHRFGPRFDLGTARRMMETFREPSRTFCAMSDPLRNAYRPRIKLPERFEKCFEPLRITDPKGGLSEAYLKARPRPVMAGDRPS